ncbi:unnamed protein product [Moneuplotes crassus]|uniref:Uncharacterized protein n=1 Tax=Euplotes crassus TaxID=5936 RepID=A0AAD1UK50_EUPCR|nr:unnamed protein product [Moneuplotes crassus]
MILCAFIVAVLLFEIAGCCSEGFFKYNQGCKPCNSSCKTCSDDTSCDSCESFMTLDPASSLCAHCADDEYYDTRSESCKSCMDTCLGVCSYRKTCMTCAPGQSLDIQTLECVDDCQVSQIKLEGPSLSVPSACRTPDYYVDPLSTEILELGTREHPYRTMKAVSSEILTFLSHREVNVTINVKDVYLEDYTLFALNMTGLTIKSHPGYTEASRKALIIPTEFTQVGISKKARLHLLNTADLPVENVLNAGNFMDSERLQILRRATIVFARTEIKFDSIDLYREEEDYNKGITFSRAIYLQDRTLTFSDMKINITGTFFETSDPFNIVIRNIEFDTYSMTNILAVYIFCNYPEANQKASVDIDGLKFTTSKDRTSASHPNGFMTNHPGNWTVKNLNAEDFYSTLGSFTYPFYYMIIAQLCLPNDGLIQTATFENFYLSVNNSKRDRINSIGASTSAFHYRSTFQTYRNLNFHGYEDTTYIPALLKGQPIDTINLESFKFQNSTLRSALVTLYNVKKVTIGNPCISVSEGESLPSCETVIQNIGGFYTNLITVSNVHEVEIKNIRVTNVTAPFSQSSSLLSLENFEDSKITVEDIHVREFNSGNGGLLSIPGNLKAIQIKMTVVDSSAKPGLSLFQINSIGSLAINGFIAQNISVNQRQDENSAIFDINALNMQGNPNSTLENIDISNCGISVLKFGSILNNNTLPSIFELKNFTVRDSVLTSTRSIISTSNLESDADFTLKLNGFYSSNVTFESKGDLLFFDHGLVNPVIVENSVFTNLKSVSITLRGSDSVPNIVREVSFKNCTFSNIYSISQSLVRVSEQATVNFIGSSFDSVSSSSDWSGIVEATSSSITKFYNTNFTRNAAVTSTLFNVQLDAYLECNSCFITHNFGISSAVISVLTDGYFKFSNCIITENIAIQKPIGQIVDAAKVSIIDRTQIFNNSIITPSVFDQETSGVCSQLCFLDQRLIDYINNSQLQSIPEGFELIEIVSGSLEIINNTQIYHQNGILNVFMSSLKMAGSILRNINFTNTPVKLTSSIFELQDMLLTNIQDNSANEIFLVNDESQIIARNITYNNSNTRLLRVLSGKAELSIFTASNITDFDNLAFFFSCQSVKISDATLSDLKAKSDQIIKIESSLNVSLDSLFINSLQQIAILISKSMVESIRNMNISNCTKAFKIVKSNVNLIESSILNNNGGQNNFIKGGAIKIIDSTITISNTSLSNNIADIAGAVDFECSSTVVCKLEINNSTFQNNSASIQGGAINYNLKRPKLLDSCFINNSAQYGPDLASYPVKIRLKNDLNSNIELSGIGSGVAISSPLEIALLDYDNQEMNLNNEDQIGIFTQIGSSASVEGINSFPFKSGIANIEGIIFVSQPGSKNVTFNAHTSAIDSKKVSTAFPNKDFSSNITVDFRFCEPGEEITQQNTCRECDAGTYSLIWNSTQCVKCMNNAECLGRNQVSVSPGYWRASQTSTFIAECINKDACNGGFSSGTLHPVDCAEGYQGELCAQCLANENVKYRKTGNSKCEKCPSPVWNAILVIGLGFIVFAFVMMLIVINIRKTKESELSVLLRILTNYLQLIFTSLSLSSSYPVSMIQFFEATNRFGDASQTFLSFDCFIRDYQITSPFSSNAILKVFLLSILPLILFGVVALIWIILYFIKRKYVKTLQRNLAISFISILFLLHPKLTEQSLGLLRCVEIDEGDRRVRIDTSIKCYSSDHILYIATISSPILIIWVILLPVTALILLFIYIKRQSDNKIKQYFLILYQGLKRDKFYWEFVNTARKIFILIIFPLPVSMKMLVAVVGLVVFARIQMKLQPYTISDNNNLEILAISAGILTLFSGLLYSQESEMATINFASMIFSVMFNICFLAHWLYLLSKSMKDSSKLLHAMFKFLTYLLCKEKKKEKINKEEPGTFRNDTKKNKKKKRTKKYKNHKRIRGASNKMANEKREKRLAILNKNEDVLFSKNNIDNYLMMVNQENSSSSQKEEDKLISSSLERQQFSSLRTNRKMLKVPEHPKYSKC